MGVSALMSLIQIPSKHFEYYFYPCDDLFSDFSDQTDLRIEYCPQCECEQVKDLVLAWELV